MVLPFRLKYLFRHLRPAKLVLVVLGCSPTDGVSGTINATMSDGKTYSGQFFQITKDTESPDVRPSGW
jgi:hypothetical protein